MGEDRPVGFVEILWDSIQALEDEWRPTSSVVCGIYTRNNVISWDSMGTKIQNYIN